MVFWKQAEGEKPIHGNEENHYWGKLVGENPSPFSFEEHRQFLRRAVR